MRRWLHPVVQQFFIQRQVETFILLKLWHPVLSLTFYLPLTKRRRGEIAVILGYLQEMIYLVNFLLPNLWSLFALGLFGCTQYMDWGTCSRYIIRAFWGTTKCGHNSSFLLCPWWLPESSSNDLSCDRITHNWIGWMTHDPDQNFNTSKRPI